MAIIQSSSFKAGTNVTIYLLKADGSIDSSVTPIEVRVLANGTFIRNVHLTMVKISYSLVRISRI